MTDSSQPRIRVLVADDEAPARQTLRLLLASDPDVELVAECVNGDETVAAIRKLRPDLVFLDIQMPRKDGFAVLDELGQDAPPAVVFVTAYAEHAVRAFEVCALDYLLKPFDDERFARSLRRAKEELREGRVHELTERLTKLLQAIETPAAGYRERIVVKESGRISFLPVTEIDWIESEDYYVEIHVAGRGHLVREPIKSLEATLDPRRFVRIHRSTIVNLERIQSLLPLTHGEYVVLLQDGTRLKVSRHYRDRVRSFIERE